MASREFWVYKWFTLNHSNKPKCVGILDDGGIFKSGLDTTQLRSHGHIMNDKRVRDFDCAAISDNLIAIAGLGTGCLMIFSIADREHSLGKCIFTLDKPDRVINKILFNPDSTELVLLSYAPADEKEIWEFYFVARFLATGTGRRPSRSEEFPPDSELVVNMNYPVKRKGSQILYPYRTRDAKFSPDGQRLVACTRLVHRSALVSILVKDGQNGWKVWGHHQIKTPDLDNWDENCLGFTGVSLYEPSELLSKM